MSERVAQLGARAGKVVITEFKRRQAYNIAGKRIEEVDILGEGGYGFIFKVQDLDNPSKRYALKKMICQTTESKNNFDN